MPLLSLGFMLAARSALDGGPMHPGQFIEPLRGERTRRRAMLVLCGLHALAGLAVFTLWNVLYGEPFHRFAQLMAAGTASQEEVARAYLDERLQASLLALTVLWSLFVSAPFWHAPALVHWGGQSVAQALFSSLVAMWRTKGAFTLYFVGWAGVSLLFSLLSGVVLGLLGLLEAAAVAALPAMLMFSTAFYVSLYFAFTDTFGTPE